MIRKKLKNTNKNETIKNFLAKYKISSDYTSISRKMIARGAFIGIFIAMIPMPMQMLAVLLFTPFGRFNVPVALTMCWVTNPITMPFIYYIEYITGSFILASDPLSVQLTLEWFNSNFDKILLPLYIGAFFYSVMLSFLSYYVITHFWKKSVYKERIK